MKLFAFDIAGIRGRLTALAMALSLCTGGNLGVLRVNLSLTTAPTENLAPWEEERGKSGSERAQFEQSRGVSARPQRHARPVAMPRQLAAPANCAHKRPLPVPDSHEDLRNGLGAPLLC